MRAKPTGVARRFDNEQIIVSKTDARGRITYANDLFLKLAGYEENEVLGQPHSLIRHPDMPRCVFKLLWDTIASKHEIFAYVINMAKNGDHYWVLAHVTPTYGRSREIVGYHSNRRAPDASALAVVEPLYRELAAEERKYAGKAEQMTHSTRMLQSLLDSKKTTYPELIASLCMKEEAS